MNTELQIKWIDSRIEELSIAEKLAINSFEWDMVARCISGKIELLNVKQFISNS